MKKTNLTHKILRGIYSYLLFFLLVSFLVTCTTMLFVRTLSASLNVEFTAENIGTAAKLTFANVIALSVLYTLIDAIRRKFMAFSRGRMPVAELELVREHAEKTLKAINEMISLKKGL